MKHLASMTSLPWIRLGVQIIRTGTIVLLAYAAVSKILDATLFKAQLHDSAYLHDYAGIISWLVPYSELLICLLLATGKTQRAGLYAALALMLAFTAYIILMLTGPADIPCSCGGILQSMGWSEHLLFNMLVNGLLLASILLSPRQKPDGDEDTSIAQEGSGFSENL